MNQKQSHLGQELIVFLKDFFNYLYTRLRQVSVVFWVGGEVALSAIENLKKVLMRYVFWGRGNWYRFAVMSAIGVSVVLLPFTLYRKPITQEILAEERVVQDVSETDLLVERGSSQTLIPKGRSRMDILTYTVSGGDTISTIAEKYGLTVQTLLWANGMSESDFIKPGQQLKIPPGNGVVHVVEEGDTLGGVSEEYSAAEQAIVDLNTSLWDGPPFDLTVGEVLFVPDGTMPPPPTPPTVASAPTVSTGYSYPNVTPVTVPSTGRFLGWPVAGGGGTSFF